MYHRLRLIAAARRAKQDAKEVGGTVTNAVGTGLDKAGDGLNTAGEKVKGVGK